MPNDMEDHLLTVLSVASGVPKEEISRDSRMEDLAFDSLVVSELSLKLRKEFGVTGSTTNSTCWKRWTNCSSWSRSTAPPEASERRRSVASLPGEGGAGTRERASPSINQHQSEIRWRKR